MKRTKVTWQIAVVALVIALAAGCGTPAGEKIELRLRLKKGDSFELSMTMDQDVVQKIQGRKHGMKQTMRSGYTMDVLDVDAEQNATIKVTYNAILFRQKSAAALIEYDSADPPETVHPAAQGFAGLVGQGFSMTLSPEGFVLDVQGADEMMDNVIASFDLDDESVREDLAESTRAQWGSEAMKEMMESVTAIYPDGPVGVGDSWRREVTVTKGFPSTMENTWTLKHRKGGLAMIGLRSKVKPNRNAAPMALPNMSLSYELSGTQSGTIWLQEATGWTTSSEMTQDFSGKLTVDTKTAGQSVTLPITIKSVIKVESTPK